MTALRATLAQFLAEYFRLEPLRATAAGMHDHDARWPDLSEAGRSARLAFVDSWDRRLAEFEAGALTPDERIDRDLVRMELAAIRFADINGNGSTDIIWTEAGSSVLRYLDVSSGSKAWLLTSITNTLGSAVRADYRSSVAYMAWG